MRQLIRRLADRALFHVGQRVRARHVLAAVARLAPAAGQVLDAGSGGGGLALALAGRHRRLRIEGLEIEPEKVAASAAAARARGLENVAFRVGDVTRIERSGHYDLVLSVDVLEHVADDGAAFRSLAAALRPGGVALIHVPRARPRRFFRALAAHEQDDHVREGYEPDDLAAQLQAAGLAEIAIGRTFGAAGELAWEIMHLLRRGRSSRRRELILIALSPLLLGLCELDYRLGGGSQGNGLLAVARRPADPSREPLRSAAAH